MRRRSGGLVRSRHQHAARGVDHAHVFLGDFGHDLHPPGPGAGFVFRARLGLECLDFVRVHRGLIERLIQVFGLLDQPGIVLADGERGNHGNALGGHQAGEFLGNRALDDGVRQRIHAGENGLAGTQFAGGVHGGADAALVVVLHDALHQVHGQARDGGPRAPAALLVGELEHVGLARDVRVQQRLGLGPVVDQRGAGGTAMAARIGHDSAGCENTGAFDFSRAFLPPQFQDEIRVIPGVVEQGEAAVQVAVQRLQAGFEIRGGRFLQPFRRGAHAAAQVNVHVHHARHQVAALAIQHVGAVRGLQRGVVYCADAPALHRYPSAGNGRRTCAVQQRHVFDQEVLRAGRGSRCKCKEQCGVDTGAKASGHRGGRDRREGSALSPGRVHASHSWFSRCLNTMPSRITKRTSSTALMSSSGLAASPTRSAALPGCRSPV